MSNAADVSSRLSGAAVQRAILADALQHPTTLYPFAIAAVAASYSIFMAPFLGGQPWALLLALGSGLGSVASFGWRYFVQGESAARAATIYECPSCDTRYLGEQRCPDCGIFCRKLGPGGPCPHCEEPVVLTHLLPWVEGGEAALH